MYQSGPQPRPTLACRCAARRATLHFTVVPDAAGVDRYGSAGWWPQEPVEVTTLGKDKPASKAGIQLGDIITRADSAAMTALPALFEHLQEGKGKPVALTVLRHGKKSTSPCSPLSINPRAIAKPITELAWARSGRRWSSYP